ncbi:helix-turn-helix transcriptional regulator [Mesorhizobium sp. M0185]|uniref:helix-turn-helix domain-containing protein n=1 Tax=Mesorhizobium sp. M0185 TaxID=2956907 RepID=UPI00333623AC
MSQEALAHELGVDRTYVSALERRSMPPALIWWQKLTRVLGIEPVDLLNPHAE